MSLRINTNIPAMVALDSVNNTSTEMQQSIQRLSTGLRINSAADDPAGLIISTDMQAQMQGVNQAISNAQDAVNMSKTADGAMAEIQTLLNNVRGLAVQAANTAVVDSTQLQADQTQIQSTIQSIDRIASQTQFGQKKLLDGTSGALANVTDATDVASIYIGGTFGGASVATGPITIAKTAAATDATIPLTNSFSSASSIVTTQGTFVINGYSFQSTGNETLQSLADNVNTMSSTTGVSASIVNTAGSYSIQLNQNTYGSQFGINYFDPSHILNSTSSASSTGTDAQFNVSLTTNQGVKTVAFTGGQGAQSSGLLLTDTSGNQILLNDAGNQNITTATQVGELTAGQVQFQIGAFSGQSVQFSMPTVFASNLGTGAIPGQSMATVNVTSQQGAQNAMSVIDNAVSQLAEMRGQLGAFQTDFLDSTVRSLNVAQQNLSSTESQIKDVDMAQEITNYTRLQILQQSGMAVLAQANQQPQQVLTLLQKL